MGAKLTRELAKARVIEIHGDIFDLSKLVYSKSLNEVVIGCKKHGDFSIVFKALTLTNNHTGCPTCSREAQVISRTASKGVTASIKAGKIADNVQLAIGRKSVSQARKLVPLLKKFAEIHGDRNDYSNVVYTRMDEKVEIRCKEHDQVFHQSPVGHLLAQGCPKCSYEKRSEIQGFTQEEFIQRATEAHNGEYDYSASLYDSKVDNVDVRCKVHGVFTITASDHMRGRGCQKCSLESRVANSTSNKDEFVARARALYGDKCDYSLVNYVTARVKVKIRCVEHDRIYEQTPDTHLRNVRGANIGCRTCANASMVSARSAGIGGFLDKAEFSHPGKYEYKKVEYINARTHVVVTCKEHGDFRVTPWLLWLGTGCQMCQQAKPGGFATSKAGMLYVMTCGDVTKVGITNSSLAGRTESISKSYGGKFEVARTYAFDCGKVCSDTETALLRIMRMKYENPSRKFDGYTEAFLNVDRPWLYEQIEMLGVENV